MINIFQWHYSLLVIPVISWLSINNAQADITCTASMSTNTVNISNAITPANANNAEITATLNYSCTNNTESSQYVSVCLGVDGGSHLNRCPNTSVVVTIERVYGHGECLGPCAPLAARGALARASALRGDLVVAVGGHRVTVSV